MRKLIKLLAAPTAALLLFAPTAALAAEADPVLPEPVSGEVITLPAETTIFFGQHGHELECLTDENGSYADTATVSYETDLTTDPVSFTVVDVNCSYPEAPVVVEEPTEHAWVEQSVRIRFADGATTHAIPDTTLTITCEATSTGVLPVAADVMYQEAETADGTIYELLSVNCLHPEDRLPLPEGGFVLPEFTLDGGDEGSYNLIDVICQDGLCAPVYDAQWSENTDTPAFTFPAVIAPENTEGLTLRDGRWYDAQGTWVAHLGNKAFSAGNVDLDGGYSAAVSVVPSGTTGGGLYYLSVGADNMPLYVTEAAGVHALTNIHTYEDEAANPYLDIKVVDAYGFSVTPDELAAAQGDSNPRLSGATDAPAGGTLDVRNDDRHFDINVVDDGIGGFTFDHAVPAPTWVWSNADGIPQGLGYDYGIVFVYEVTNPLTGATERVAALPTYFTGNGWNLTDEETGAVGTVDYHLTLDNTSSNGQIGVTSSSYGITGAGGYNAPAPRFIAPVVVEPPVVEPPVVEPPVVVPPVVEPPVVQPPVVTPPVVTPPVTVPPVVTPPADEVIPPVVVERDIPEDSSLVRTGGELPAPALWVGLVALLLGASALLFSRLFRKTENAENI